MTIVDSKKIKVQFGESTLVGFTDSIPYTDHEESDSMGNRIWFGHTELFLSEGSRTAGPVVNLPVSASGPIGWSIIEDDIKE